MNFDIVGNMSIPAHRLLLLFALVVSAVIAVAVSAAAVVAAAVVVVAFVVGTPCTIH